VHKAAAIRAINKKAKAHNNDIQEEHKRSNLLVLASVQNSEQQDPLLEFSLADFP